MYEEIYMAHQQPTELTRLTDEVRFVEDLRSDVFCNLKQSNPLHMLALINQEDARWTYRNIIEA